MGEICNGGSLVVVDEGLVVGATVVVVVGATSRAVSTFAVVAAAPVAKVAIAKPAWSRR